MFGRETRDYDYDGSSPATCLAVQSGLCLPLLCHLMGKVHVLARQNETTTANNGQGDCKIVSATANYFTFDGSLCAVRPNWWEHEADLLTDGTSSCCLVCDADEPDHRIIYSRPLL